VELDKTEITIRERSILQLLDLSLLVVRRHFSPLVLTSLIVGAPFMPTNVLATAWMVNEESRMVAVDRMNSEAPVHWRHSWHLVALWSLEFPLVSLPITVFLGNKIFFEHLTVKKLLSLLRPLAGRALFVLGILRFGVLGLVLEWQLNTQDLFEPWIEIFALGICLFGLAMVMRATHPFAPEILGLEMCRLKSSAGGELTYWRRSKWLHRALLSDNVNRFMTCTVAAVCLAGMLLSLQVFLFGVLIGRWQWNIWFDHLLLPITLWLTSIYEAVFRFLAYLDSRIRLEGWEIELQIRAEARRWEQAETPPISALPSVAAETTASVPEAAL